MSCYFRHLTDLFEEAGVTLTAESRPAMRARLAQLVGDTDGDCSTTWKLIKEWKADPRRRKRLLRAIKTCGDGATGAAGKAPPIRGVARGVVAVRDAVAQKAAQARQVTSDVVEEAFDWATHVDVEGTKEAVRKLRARHPKATPGELAEGLMKSTRLWTTAAGVGTGLPANPWVSGGAGVVDAAVSLRLHARMVAQIALLYDPGFLDDPEAHAEMLLIVFGVGALSQSARTGAVLGGMGVTRQGVKRLLTGSRLRAFRNLMLKYFGQTVGQKAVVTKVLPVVGAVVGGGWNFAETSVVGARAIRYFENQPLDGQ